MVNSDLIPFFFFFLIFIPRLVIYQILELSSLQHQYRGGISPIENGDNQNIEKLLDIDIRRYWIQSFTYVTSIVLAIFSMRGIKCLYDRKFHLSFVFSRQ